MKSNLLFSIEILKNPVYRLLIPFLWLFQIPAALFGQTGSGSFTGAITDQSSAPIPAVSVVVVNEETGTKLETVTDDGGRYRVGSLSPGNYRIEAVKAGFENLARRGLVLTTGQTVAVAVALKIGAVGEMVTVTEASPLTETNANSVLARNILVTKLDHQWRTNHHFTARYYLNDAGIENQGSFGTPVSDPNANTNDVRVQSLLGSYTRIIRPTLVNDLKVSFFQRKFIDQRYGADEDFAGKIGLRGVGKAAFPNIAIPGYVALSAPGTPLPAWGFGAGALYVFKVPG